MDGSTGAGEAGFWSFLASVGTVVVSQLAIMWRAKRKAEKNRAGLNSHDAEVLLENKDSRAFKFLVDRLDISEKAHKACEDRADEMLGKFGMLARKFDLAIYSMDVLKATMEQGGIKLPPLPLIERS